MKASRLLLLSTLVEKRACLSQVNLFRERFGESVKVTEALCVRVRNEFDLYWAACNLFSAPAWKEYEKVVAPAWKEYKKVVAPARKEYEKVRATAWEEYERVRATAWKEYEKAIAPAREEYDKATAMAREKHKKARARAFARAYINDGREE